MYTFDSSTGCSEVVQLRNLDIDPLDIKMTAVEDLPESDQKSFLFINLTLAIFSDFLVYTSAKKHLYEEQGVLEF